MEGTAVIPLRKRDGTVCGETVVDADQHDALARHCWRMMCSHGNRYAVRFSREGGLFHAIFMHRVVLGISSGIADHINGDGLDNRRANLRVATRSQNCANQRKRRASAVGLKGVTVSKNRKNRRFQAQIRHDGSNHHLGYFATAQEAHRAYCHAAEQAFGPFACNGER